MRGSNSGGRGRGVTNILLNVQNKKPSMKLRKFRVVGDVPGGEGGDARLDPSLLSYWPNWSSVL